MNNKVRVRFAPSPTGYLHVGGARTALYNYLYAKKMGGDFILRIEDTDQARSTDEALKMVMEDLVWLNLLWDEGPKAEGAGVESSGAIEEIGSMGPYRQSRRLSIYQEVAQELINNGKAYYCFMSDEEITKQRDSLKAQSRPPHVESPWENSPLDLALEKIKSGEKAVVRFKTRQLKKDYLVKDLVRGEIKFPSDMVGDFIMLRSDGMPVYNFCCVVDDYKMKMTHVLRAEEHLPNTLRQLMLYEAMNWEAPQFGHLSLVLDEDRQKLSKRKGATSCHEFKQEGYLPEALKNFVLLLGWSHPEAKEIMSLKEMISSFDLSRLHAAGAVFDPVKLKWMNAQYIRALPPAELWQLIQPFLKADGQNFDDVTPDWIEKSLAVMKTAFETLLEAVPLYRTLSDSHYAVEPEGLDVLKWPTTDLVINSWVSLINEHSGEDFTEVQFLEMQKKIQETAKVKGKDLFFALRVAIIGRPHGAELKQLVPLMKKKSLILRAEKAMKAK